MTNAASTEPVQGQVSILGAALVTSLFLLVDPSGG